MNINLNTFSINLKGFSIKYRIEKESTIFLYNGTIKNSSQYDSKIYVDINGKFKNMVTLLGDRIEVIYIDKASILSDTLDYVSYNLHNSGYNYLNDSLINHYSDSHKCLICNQNSNCIYTYSDLLFIDSYSNGNVNITYESSDETVLNDYGNILADGDVTLTVTVSDLDGNTLSKEFNVHVNSTVETKQLASINDIIRAMKYDDEKNAYKISGSILLPASISYYGALFEYKVYDARNNALPQSKFIEEIKKNDTVLSYVFSYSSAVKKLGIVSTIDGSSKEITVDITGIIKSDIIDNNTIALNIFREAIGSEIQIRKTETGNGINGYSFQELPIASNYAYRFVSSFTYSLLNNDIDNTYAISNNRLYVQKEGVRYEAPSVLQAVFLKIVVEFSDDSLYSPKTVTLTIPIKYIDDDVSDPTGISQFRPYYNYFNKQLQDASSGYTYNDFMFPQTFGSEYVIYRLTPKLANIKGEEVIGCINYNSQTLPVIKDGTNYYTQAGGTRYYGDTHSITINGVVYQVKTDIVKFQYYYQGQYYDSIFSLTEDEITSGILKSSISINILNLPEVDLVCTLSYEYIMVKNSTYWSSNGNFESVFVIPGLYRFGENERFESEILYNTVYNKLYGIDRPISSYIIVTDTYKNIELNFDNDKTISSYKGIETLACTSLSIKGSVVNQRDSKNAQDYTGDGTSLRIEDLSYISQMEYLEYLDISGNGLMDYDSMSVYGFPEGNRNDFIKTLSQLKTLEVLHLENNQIFYFDSLVYFPSLKTVYTYNNFFISTVSIKIFSWDIGQYINDIMNGINNDMYGSKGSLNSAAYSTLSGRGVTIYNDRSGSFVSNTQTNTLIENLSSLIYQRQIGADDSIDIVYNNYSTFWSDYNVSSTGTSSKMSMSIVSNDWGTDVTVTNNYQDGYETVEFVAIDSNGNEILNTDVDYKQKMKEATRFRIKYIYTIYYRLKEFGKDPVTDNIYVPIYVDYEVGRL